MSDTAAQLVVEVSGRDINASALLNQLEQRMQSGEAMARAYRDELAKLGNIPASRSPVGAGASRNTDSQAASVLRLQRAQASLEMQEARLARTQGDVARAAQLEETAIRRLQSTLSQQNSTTTQSIAVQRQLISVQQQQARAAQSATESTQASWQSMASGFLSVAGPAAAATAGIVAFQAIVNKTVEGFQLAAVLDEQRRSVGVFVGDIEKGNQVFADAAAFGKQYGFTQREMGEAAAAAAPLLRTSTVETQKQLEVLGRLAALNSAEGFTGAVFSTKELASGDVTSIVERFNLSRDAAYEMRDAIAAGADVFDVLDQKLNEMGATSDILANRMIGAAGASRTFAMAQEDLSLALGRIAEGPGVKALSFLADFTNTLANIVSGDAFGTGDQVAGIEAQLLAGAGSFEEYASRALAAKAQIDAAYANDPAAGWIAQQIAGFGQLTPIQFEYARSLIASGESATSAMAQAQAAGSTANLLASQFQLLGTANAEASSLMSETSGKLMQIAMASEQGANTVFSLTQELAAGNITTDQYNIVLDANIRALEIQAQAAALAAGANAANTGETDANTNAVSAQTQAMIDATYQALEASKASQELTAFQERLAGLAGLVSSGQISVATAAQILAQAYGFATEEAARLLNMQMALAAAPPPAITSQSSDELDVRGWQRGIREAEQAQRQMQARINSTTSSPARRSSGGGGTGRASTALSDQQKLNNTLLNDQQRYEDQAEKQAREHARRLLDIEKDFQERSLQQQRANEVSKRQGELGFLKALTGSDLNKTQGGSEELQRINAQYYADFEAAQAQAQAGNAALAAELVALAGERAKVELDYAEQIAAAKERKDAGEVARLEALRDKEREILAEQHKQTLEGGDTNVNARDEALQGEQERYAEQQAENATAAENAAERKISAAERAGKAIEAENLLLKEQEGILNRLGTTPGANVATGAATTTAEGAAAIETNKSLPPDVAAIAEGLIALSQQLAAVITSSTSDIISAQRDTTSAVRGLNGIMR